jgi:uncharacterized protein YlxP (DUF503 family)
LCEPFYDTKYYFYIEQCLQRGNVNYEITVIAMTVSATYVEENLLLRRIVQQTKIKFSININEYAITDRISR